MAKLGKIFSIKKIDAGKRILITCLGIKISLRTTMSKFQRLENEIKDLKEFIYQTNYIPTRVATLHQKVFPQFHNIHNNDDIVIVGCGPTVKHYSNPPVCISGSTYHISLNRAIRQERIKFDYAFVWDLPAFRIEEPAFIPEFLNYDCIKFVGQFLNDAYNVPMDLNMPYKNKLYRCYSASRAGFGLETCDPIIHQDLSLFPLADFMSIAFAALNFAAYTHPKRIFLVGLDTKQVPCFDGRNHSYFMDDMKKGYIAFKEFFTKYYPDTEVISINPVGLKGLFKDVYTQSYINEHPELLKKDIQII